MLHEEAKACVAVPQSLWLLSAYDPRDTLEKPTFLYLLVSCPPSLSSSKVGGLEGAEGVTPKSIPLGHKSGIFQREKKGNIYATSMHFPCFLQSRSNCKTVFYLRDPPVATVLHPPVGTMAMQYYTGRPGVSSLSPRDQIYPSFSGYSSKERGWNC